MGHMENSSSATVSASGEYLSISSHQIIKTPPLTAVVPPKKKRNLPGMPDPDADVIALSPNTLLATNRFICEVCGKGFQRDQNLQLHRRGHNLPWKLKQRNGKEVRKRVYVCPEVTCVHHSPSRALGDLTGIKKHFSRKHGEKKWKCDRCSKKYAVLSDWKAHMKTCGTREYRCDCGTLFSRRDSFTTHRAFCDALAEESVNAQRTLATFPTDNECVNPPSPPSPTPSTAVLSPGLSMQSSETQENPILRVSSSTQTAGSLSTMKAGPAVEATAIASSSSSSSSTTSVFASIFSSSATLEPTSLCLSPSLYLSTNSFPADQYSAEAAVPPPQQPAPPPAMSATALLQKAAQMGAAASNQSLLRGLGLASTSAPQPLTSFVHQDHIVKTEVLGLGHQSGGPATLDLLGLGLNPNGGPRTGLSALLTSFGGGLSIGAAALAATSYGGGSSSGQEWYGGPDRKLKGPTLQ